MPKAKSQMFHILISDLFDKQTEQSVSWDGLLHRLRGAQSVGQYPDALDTPELFIEELKKYFEANGVYALLNAQDKLISLQLGRSKVKHAMVTFKPNEQVRIMVPDYLWAIHLSPKFGDLK